MRPSGRAPVAASTAVGRRAVILLAALAVTAAGPPARAFGPLSADPADARHYAFTDALFLQRNNATIDRPLVTAGGAVAIASGQFESPVATGTRIFVGEFGGDAFETWLPGWEVGYVGVYGMAGRRQATDPAGDLAAAGPLGTVVDGFDAATLATATYDSQINSAEANLVWHRFVPGRVGCTGGAGGWPPPASPTASRSLDWLLGFRWVGLEETAALGFLPAGGATPSTYAVSAASNMFAGQTGVRGRWTRDRWALEGWAKLGLAGIDAGQTQTITDPSAAAPFRPLRSGTDGNVGLVSDLMLSAIWRINDRCGLRVGYNLLWLTGVALAPDQFDFSASTGPEAGTGVQRTGSLFLNGASAGVEARW